MAIIVPALLEQSREALADKLFQAERLLGVERIQVDFADGQFVPHATLDIKQMDTLNPAFHWEAHLMVREPRNFLDYQIVGFQTLILHYEAFASEHDLDNAASEISKLGMTPAVAINPETSPSALRYFGDTINHFVLLSVQPGRQGQGFLPQSVERMAELRKLLPHAILEVDGGVELSNASTLASAGADQLAVGSALFETKNIDDTYLQLQQAATNIKPA